MCADVTMTTGDMYGCQGDEGWCRRGCGSSSCKSEYFDQFTELNSFVFEIFKI